MSCAYIAVFMPVAVCTSYCVYVLLFVVYLFMHLPVSVCVCIDVCTCCILCVFVTGCVYQKLCVMFECVHVATCTCYLLCVLMLCSHFYKLLILFIQLINLFIRYTNKLYYYYSFYPFNFFKLCLSTCINYIFILQSDILLIILSILLHFYTYLTYNLI